MFCFKPKWENEKQRKMFFCILMTLYEWKWVLSSTMPSINIPSARSWACTKPIPQLGTWQFKALKNLLLFLFFNHALKFLNHFFPKRYYSSLRSIIGFSSWNPVSLLQGSNDVFSPPAWFKLGWGDLFQILQDNWHLKLQSTQGYSFSNSWTSERKIIKWKLKCEFKPEVNEFFSNKQIVYSIDQVLIWLFITYSDCVDVNFYILLLLVYHRSTFFFLKHIKEFNDI